MDERAEYSRARRKRMGDFVRRNSTQVQIFVKSGNKFLSTVRSFISWSVQKGKLTQDKGRTYFKEILHVILFYGQINNPIITPEEILTEKEIEQLSGKYRDVFRKYATHLPTRPPYTVLLDAIVEITETRNAEKVLTCLLNLTNEMDVTNDEGRKCENIFVSTVISCCYLDDSSANTNYFGASVSCRGLKQRQIMIDILCCHTWHKDIGWAVCVGKTYNKNAFGFPAGLCSMAFNIYSSAKATIQEEIIKSAWNRLQRSLMTRSYEISKALEQYGTLVPREPCMKCFTMFPDIYFDPHSQHHGQGQWEYGNCAECESLSQLLYSNQQVVEQLDRKTFQLTSEMLLKVKCDRLECNLRELGFRLLNEILYYYD
ncbi:uncharacterized protein LOC121293863 [Carcharodon carcharias]|uniref:uncharacterized protein LOC121293863 n=1 Tax=Carcharodon carcharias TaxID=13397 RepID=UPI001B7DF7AA|nr:uncharacterized protein LOC121293863 [Carcharodon carcharias]